MKTKVYTADTSSLSDGVLFSYYYGRMSAERREKIDGVRLDEDKRLSLGVGILLDIAADECGVRDKTISLCENGKPFFMYSPDVFFSLSHSGERVMCVVSDAPVGCDTEMIDKCNYRLAERFYSLAEREYVLSFDGDIARKTAFCRIWTLKESYVKMLGTGFVLPFTDFSIDVSKEKVSVECASHDTDCSFT